MKICRSWLMIGHDYMHLWSTKKKNCRRPVWRLTYYIHLHVMSYELFHLAVRRQWTSGRIWGGQASIQQDQEQICQHLPMWVNSCKVDCWSTDDYGNCDWCIYAYHISDDFSRVKLQEIKGVEGSEYVNASYIDVRTMFIVMWSSDVNTLSGAHNNKERPA